MKAVLNTGRTIQQGKAVENKGSYEYRMAASVCYMNPVDLMELGIDEGTRVLLTTRAGRVVLTTRASEGLERGEVFVPLGCYANHVIPAETHATGMPDFKSVTVDIAPTDELVKDIDGIMNEIGGAVYDH